MKVKQLIKELSKLDPDSEVIMQKDSEGNYYSPLYCVDGNAVYVPDSTWSGVVYSRDWNADDCCMEDAEYKKVMKKKSCCVLAPVN
jgi:hypothetical protein